MPTNVIVNEIFENLAPNPATPETRSLVIGPLHQIRKQVSFGTYDMNDTAQSSYSFPGVYAGATPNVFFYEPVVSDSINYKVRFPHLTEDEDNNLTYIIENPTQFKDYTETVLASSTYELFHAQPVKGSVKMFSNIVITAAPSAFDGSHNISITPVHYNLGGLQSVTVTTSADVLLATLVAGTDYTVSGNATTDIATVTMTSASWTTYGETASNKYVFTGTTAWPSANFSVDENSYTLTTGSLPTFSGVAGTTIVRTDNFVQYDFFPVVGPALHLIDRADGGMTSISPRNYTVKEVGGANLIYLSDGQGTPILDLGIVPASGFAVSGAGPKVVAATGDSTWSFFPVISNGDKATGNYLRVVYGGVTYLHAIDSVGIDGSISVSATAIGGGVTTDWSSGACDISVVYGDYSGTVVGTFSALRTDKVGYIYSASNAQEVQDQLQFGSSDSDWYVEPANPIAYGMLIATSNGSNNILFSTVATDDLVGYNDALDGAGNDRTVYEIFPLTLNKDISDAVVAHCSTYSIDTNTGDNKKRCCMICLPFEDADVINDSIDPDHPSMRKGTSPVLANATTLQVSQATANFFSDGVAIGDRVAILTGINAGDYYVYHVGTSTLTLINDLSSTAPKCGAGESDTFNTCGFIVYKNYKTSKAAYATAIAAVASPYRGSDANYRTKVLWPYVWEDFTLADGRVTALPGYFAAVGYAGIFSTIRPQQGLTRYPLGSVGTPKYVNEYFKYADLNKIEDGALWVMYRTGTGTACRMQYTAAGGAGGEALAGQRSIVCIADVISKRLHDTLYQFTGIFNITPTNLPMFRTAAESVLQRAKKETYTRIGPLIIQGRVEKLEVAVEPRQINLIVAIVPPESVDVFYIQLVVKRFTGGV